MSMDGVADTRSYGSWHRIGDHTRDHDEGEHGYCAWDDVFESGTVPDSTPPF